MSNWNKFYKKVYSSPALMWKGGAAFLFIAIGLAVLVMPSLTGGTVKMRAMLGGMITAYGLFRLWTFYMEYNSLGDE